MSNKNIQGIRIQGDLDVTSVTASFNGNGADITGIITSSYAITASYALNAGDTLDTSSLVTIADDQTITGLKTFNNNVHISASLFVSSSATIDKSINIKTSYSSTGVNRKNIYIGENINLSGGTDGYSSSTNDNIAIGSDALKNINGFPSYNIAIGSFSGENLRADDEGDVEYNVLIGSFTGRNINGTPNNKCNTIIGDRAIQNVEQSQNNTIIGYNAMGVGGGELRHSTIIGANVNVAPDNGMVVLSDGQGNIRFFASSSGNVGIGTTTASHALTVNGAVSASSFIGDGSQLTGIGIDTSSLVTISNFNNYTSSIVVPLSNSFVNVSTSYNSFSSSFESFSQSVSASLANISFDTSSLVDLSSDQTITGIKTIANYLAFTNSATVDIGVPTTFPSVYDYNGENRFAIASRLNNESNYFSQTLLQNDSNVQKMFIGIVSGSSYSSTTPLSYLYFSNSFTSIYANEGISLNADWIGLYSTSSIEIQPQGGVYLFTPSVVDVYTENYISLYSEDYISLSSMDNIYLSSDYDIIMTATNMNISGDVFDLYASDDILVTTDALFQLVSADISTYSSGYVNIVSDGGLTFIAGSGSIIPTTSDFVFKSSTPRFLFSGSNPYSNIYIIPESDTSYVVKKFVVDNFTSASTFTAFSASVSASLAESGGGGAVYSASIGNNSATVFTVTHNLDKTNVYVTVRENPTGSFVYPDIYYSSSNVIALTFVSAPTTNQYLVSVLGA